MPPISATFRLPSFPPTSVPLSLCQLPPPLPQNVRIGNRRCLLPQHPAPTCVSFSLGHHGSFQLLLLLLLSLPSPQIALVQIAQVPFQLILTVCLPICPSGSCPGIGLSGYARFVPFCATLCSSALLPFKVFGAIGRPPWSDPSWPPPRSPGSFRLSHFVLLLLCVASPPFSSYAGAVFGLPLSAWLVSYVHWSMPFYIYGIAGVLWSLFWFSMTFEKPAFHPTISAQEKQYIESQLGPVSHTHPTVPSPSLLLPSFRSARQSFNPVPIRSVPHHSLACHPHLQTRLGHHRGQLCSQLELLPAPPEPAHLHARRVGPAHLRCACLPFPALTVPSLPTFPLEWSHCRPSPCRHGPLPLTPLPSPLTFQLLQGLCCAYRRQIGRLFALQQNPLDHCRPEAVQLRGSLPSPPSLLFPFPFKDSVARHFSCWWWPTQRVRGQRCSVSCGQGLDPTYCCQMGCPNSWNSIALSQFWIGLSSPFSESGKVYPRPFPFSDDRRRWLQVCPPPP